MPPLSTILKWDLPGGKPTTFKGHPTMVLSISLDGTGKTLAVACVDHTVLLWDYPTGQEVPLLLGHGGGVLSVLFDRDGRTLLTGGFDERIRAWDLSGLRKE